MSGALPTLAPAFGTDDDVGIERLSDLRDEVRALAVGEDDRMAAADRAEVRDDGIQGVGRMDQDQAAGSAETGGSGSNPGSKLSMGQRGPLPPQRGGVGEASQLVDERHSRPDCP